ncbi:MAG: PD-(D/E)XK nuclease family protein [Gammaproteobacteria bacterium]|jgi:ATP-dependent helicase/nuclease subunit B
MKPEDDRTVAGISLDAAFRLLEQGATLLTVNNRLSAYLHEAYAGSRQDDVWPTPDILPLGAWLARQYDELLIRGEAVAQLLQPAQETLLWELVVDDWNASQGPDEMLLRPAAAAASARQAWRLIHDWEIALEELRQLHVPETRQFLQWADVFASRCRENSWMSRDRLTREISHALGRKTIVPPETLLLGGFDEFTRAQQALLRALSGADAQLRLLDTGTHDGEARQLLCADIGQEILQAAWWARRKLEAGEIARIGIVVPQLHELRSRIEQVFDSVLHPETLAAAPAEHRRIFNITLGTPLADEPLAHDALLLLRLIAQGLHFEETGRLLRSNHVGGHRDEWERRALLDLRLRRYAPPDIRHLKFLQALQSGMGDDTAACPAFADRLEAAIAVREQSQARTYEAWGETIYDMLESLGWPGDRELDSREYQCREHFTTLLEQLGALDIAASGVGYAEALTRLARLARESLFQPEGGSDAPIQVSGPLEAGGQSYDALWVLGVNDEVWPPAARPNPLLPVGIQKARGLPHASPEVETAHYRALHERLLASAPEIIFSSSRRDGDRELRPGPFIDSLPPAEPEGIGCGALESLVATAETESVDDTLAAPVDPAVIPPGGSNILKEQAACPFQAYIHFRLAADRLEEPVTGFDARSRGTLTHRALELLWQAVESHARLVSLGEEALRAAIRIAVTQALDEERSETGLRQNYSDIEQLRLERLLWNWLELEKQRQPFRVEETEAALEIELAGLGLSLRADRTDRLEDGQRIIIDYKTGAHFSCDWESERLEEPQLPLYAIASNEETAAAVLAWTGSTPFFSGLAAEKGILPGRRVRQPALEWDALLEQWRQSLTATAADFMRGYAAVDPARPAKSCTWCNYRGMCRIDAHLVALEENDDA